MTLSITSYSDIGSTARGALAIPLEPARAVQSIEVGAINAVSEPLGDDICIAALCSAVDCKIDIGADPDATDSHRYLAAGVEKLIAVVPGSKMKVAVVGTGAGTVGSAMNSLEGLVQLIARPADFKKQLETLAAETAKHSAAAKNLTAAIGAAGWADKLSKQEANLAEREAVVATRTAELDAKVAAIRALAPKAALA